MRNTRPHPPHTCALVHDCALQPPQHLHTRSAAAAWLQSQQKVGPDRPDALEPLALLSDFDVVPHCIAARHRSCAAEQRLVRRPPSGLCLCDHMHNRANSGTTRCACRGPTCSGASRSNELSGCVSANVAATGTRSGWQCAMSIEPRSNSANVVDTATGPLGSAGLKPPPFGLADCVGSRLGSSAAVSARASAEMPRLFPGTLARDGDRAAEHGRVITHRCRRRWSKCWHAHA